MRELELYQSLCHRYGKTTEESLQKTLYPIQMPIHKIEPKVIKLYGHAHWRAHFQVVCNEFTQVGCSGKFVSNSYVEGKEIRREMAKGKIISVDYETGIARGEIYTGTPSKNDLTVALDRLTEGDYWEIDPFGVAEKVQRGLIEHRLMEIAKAAGYDVKKVIGDEHDFMLQKGGSHKRIALKNLSSIDIDCAQLSQSNTNDYFTKSSSFDSQDIFAVCLLNRTGQTADFLFAKSVSEIESPDHGLPCSPSYAEYATQNPRCFEDGKIWFSDIGSVWE